jgi:hypothetical protein
MTHVPRLGPVVTQPCACSREFGLGGHNLNGGLSVYQKRVSLLITKSLKYAKDASGSSQYDVRWQATRCSGATPFSSGSCFLQISITIGHLG